MNYEVEKRDDHILIRCPYETVASSELESLENIIEDVLGHNVILEMLAVRAVRNASKLEKIQSNFNKRDKSFIIIASQPLHEEMELPEGAAFSEKEALDILEMEEIERKI